MSDCNRFFLNNYICFCYGYNGVVNYISALLVVKHFTRVAYTHFPCNDSFENAGAKYGGLISGLSSRLTDGFFDGSKWLLLGFKVGGIR